MDIHVVQPDNQEIFWGNMCNSQGTACLDVDMVASSCISCPQGCCAVENIGWTTGLHGVYRLYAVNYSQCSSHNYDVFVKLDETTTQYAMTAPSNNAKILVMSIDYPNF